MFDRLELQLLGGRGEVGDIGDHIHLAGVAAGVPVFNEFQQVVPVGPEAEAQQVDLPVQRPLLLQKALVEQGIVPGVIEVVVHFSVLDAEGFQDKDLDDAGNIAAVVIPVIGRIRLHGRGQQPGGLHAADRAFADAQAPGEDADGQQIVGSGHGSHPLFSCSPARLRQGVPPASARDFPGAGWAVDDLVKSVLITE